MKSADDAAVEYTVYFYVAEWYRETLTESETAKQQHRQFAERETANETDVRKDERRLQKVLERGEKMKASILRLVDKKYLKRRTQYIASTENVILDSDAAWVVKYLASKREFSQSFENYLKQARLLCTGLKSFNLSHALDHVRRLNRVISRRTYKGHAMPHADYRGRQSCITLCTFCTLKRFYYP